MIPQLQTDGFLPSGIHTATLSEIQIYFGQSSDKRKQLYEGLVRAVNNLKKAGVKRLYIDGSFVSNKVNPDDIDGCWEPRDVDGNKLDSVFLDFSPGRKKMKKKYGVDFFISSTAESNSGLPFTEFFQISRDGKRKGILLLEL